MFRCVIGIMDVRDTRSLTSVELLDLRKRAVAAISSGKSIVSVASIFNVSRQAVSRWVVVVKKKGDNGLQPKRKGRPTGRNLGRVQTWGIIRTVMKKLPDEVGLPFYLWTREAIQMLIKKRQGIRLSVWTVGRLLKDWGMTPQKPVRRAYERDPEKVKEWLETAYPAIRALAHKEHALLLWEDEMGIRSDSQVGRTYALKGKTPIVPVTGNRFSCNMIAGITNRGKLYFMVFQTTFKAHVFLVFVRRLIKQAGRKVFLIADKHPAHRAKATNQFLSKHANEISFFFLPPYSPDLNPSEFLNQDVKANTIRKIRPKSPTQMISAVRNYLRSRQRTPQKLKKYFHAESVRYAAY